MAHPPRYFLTELNDSIQWLTDGHDFGMNPDAVPGLLAALEAASTLLFNEWNHLEDGRGARALDDQIDAAIAAAKGETQ